MTSCCVPGCPGTGNYQHSGKLYCQKHWEKVRHALEANWRLPHMPRVNVEGREN